MLVIVCLTVNLTTNLISKEPPACRSQMSHRTFRALRFTLPEIHLIRDSPVIAWLRAVFSDFSGSATDYMPVNSLHKYPTAAQVVS